MMQLAFSLSQAWGKVWPILFAILFFGFIILIHECGHFFFAKLFKVKVNEFAIGMGPKIFSKKGKETAYSLRAFPIGGFVSMEGEDEESADENSFQTKKAWQRFIIIAAGAICNLIFGLVLIAVLLSKQDLVGTTQVLRFEENAISDESGLQVNDEIIKINGLRLYSDRDLSYALMRGDNTSFEFVVKRGGETVVLPDVQFAATEYEGRTIVSQDFYVLGVPKTFGNMFTSTFAETASMARLVRLSLADLISGKYGLKDLSGPVGTMEIIADAATDAATGKEYGLEMIVTIMAFITINIGVVNLLPIPALDGGRLVFLLLEIIRRKPVLPKYEKYVHAGGLALLLAFMALITLKDVIYLFK
ncbi:MAG: M50 family metallopeptidase [Oscillospiraceae bacterium]|jgi:regulator of sigma E protease|nr:M50 family metallopeptidase [Oscillospiraceae bacterium]